MNHSEKIDLLTKSLVKASDEFGRVTKSSQAYNYKYADLAQVYEKVTPALLANGLALIQSPISDGEMIGVESMLTHISGQWLSNKFTTKLTKMTPQDIGSAITYYRRYSVMALLGIAPEDDDGRAAMPKQSIKEVFRPKVAPLAVAGGRLKPAERSKLWVEVQELQKIKGIPSNELLEMMSTLGANKVSELSGSDFTHLKELING